MTQVVYGNESGWYDGVASGEATAYVQTYPDFSYVSGTFHHVRLSGLQANASYYFKCALLHRYYCKLMRIVSRSAHGISWRPHAIGPEAFLSLTRGILIFALLKSKQWEGSSGHADAPAACQNPVVSVFDGP